MTPLPPIALLAEAERQKADEVADAERQLAALIERPLLSSPQELIFTAQHPQWNALRAMVVHHIIRNGSLCWWCESGSISIEPYPSKYDGAWRVSAGNIEFYVGYEAVYAVFAGE